MSLETEFNRWIEKINNSENPKSDIIAFYFGLLERIDGYSMYLIGSKEFDSEDEDWACNLDFEPKNKYLELPMEYSDGENWEEVLNEVTELLKKYAESNSYENSIFKSAIAIATGFDGGDLVRIK